MCTCMGRQTCKQCVCIYNIYIYIYIIYIHMGNQIIVEIVTLDVSNLNFGILTNRSEQYGIEQDYHQQPLLKYCIHYMSDLVDCSPITDVLIHSLTQIIP